MRLSRTTVLLLAANAACAFLVWRSLPEEGEAPGRGLTFPAVPQWVTIEGPSGRLRLERADGGWQMTEPRRWPANPWEVQRLLGELALARESPRRPIPAETKERWSLAVGADGGTVTATVAAETSASGARTALLDGGERGGATAGEGLLKSLGLPPEAYRVDAVFTISPFEARAISVRRAREGAEDQRWGLVLETREQIGRPEPAAGWRFEAPLNLAADAERTPRAVNALADLRTVRFLDRRTQPEAKPRLRISLESSSRRQVLLVWPAGPEGLAEACLEDNPDQPFLVEAKALAAWEDPVAELRSRQPCDFDPAGARGVTLTSLADQRSLTLHRIEEAGSAGRWEMPVVPGSTATRRLEVGPGRAQQFLRLLNGLRATDGRDAEVPAGLGWHRVEIEFAGGKLALELAADRGRVLVRSPGGPAAACPTDQPMGRWLSVLPEDWRSETLARLPAGTQVTRVEVVAPDGRTTASARLAEGGRWQAEGELNAGRAAALAERLAHVRAESFVAGNPAVEWRATVRATDRSAAGAAGASEALRSYRVGRARATGALLARDESDGTIFLPEPALADALAPWANP